MNELLEQAKPFCVYGSQYNRHIAVAFDDLKNAIDRGFPVAIIESVASVLSIRLERWGHTS